MFIFNEIKRIRRNKAPNDSIVKDPFVRFPIRDSSLLI